MESCWRLERKRDLEGKMDDLYMQKMAHMVVSKLT